jgi:hypothetical protein
MKKGQCVTDWANLTAFRVERIQYDRGKPSIVHGHEFVQALASNCDCALMPPDLNGVLSISEVECCLLVARTIIECGLELDLLGELSPTQKTQLMKALSSSELQKLKEIKQKGEESPARVYNG